ncbi:MAG: aminotransferase class IV [Hymenobacteraceae bacterium]|nr:aminotransferase class IV [Hymenobacteraceae bacterium]MDX5481834.1 aminotransferase class IV [Hymenobacteraceae bacterium]
MHSNPNLFASINQEVMPLDRAFLHVSDLSIQRGYGVFEYCKVHQDHPFFLEDYLDRFYNSAALMELTIPYSRESLKLVIEELTQKNNLPVSGIKMILTGGYSATGYEPEEPNLIITQQPLSMPTQEQLDRGFKIISHEYMREVPHAKTINYSIGIRLIKKIKEKGADDVLYQQQGVVSEFPRCNFFIVKQDNTIVTPAKNVLPGITRKNVLNLAARKFKVEEGTVTLEDIARAKEAFLTSTTKRIVPIVQLDETIIGNGKPGAVTLGLLEDLVMLEKEQLALVKK